MAELPLVILSLDDLSRDTIRRVSKVLGIGRNIRIERKGLRIINEVAKLSVSAYRSKVPIATGQLRNTQIMAKLTSTSPFDPEAVVYVADTPHTNSWGTPKPTGSGLAILLNEIQQRRSRTSLAEDPFKSATSGYSEGWMVEATEDLRDYVSKELGL